jgi:hypothetical protein
MSVMQCNKRCNYSKNTRKPDSRLKVYLVHVSKLAPSATDITALDRATGRLIIRIRLEDITEALEGVQLDDNGAAS